MDNRFIFSSTYSAWNKLSIHYSTEAISVTPCSSQWIRTVAPIANLAKKALIVVAFAVCTVATGVFSLISLPYRLYQWNKLLDGLETDYNLLTSQEKIQLRRNISDYIDQKEVSGKFNVPSLHKEEYIQKIMCYYARSHTVYGPIVISWAEYLLDKANAENKKLIFLARDGIAPYKMALDMMKDEEYQRKYPNLVGEDKIKLAYLSRACVDQASRSAENTELFQKYMKQLGVNSENEESYIFVDIGFQGSRIDQTRQLLPGVQIDFEYLISHTEHAQGFIYSENDPRLENQEYLQLPTIRSIPFKGAGSNPATHWLEDTHQGVQRSAEYLVEVDGVVYPNTLNPEHKEYIAPKGSLNFLLRKWCQKAIIDSRKKYSVANISKEDAVRELDATLDKIVQLQLPLLVPHN